MMKRYKIVGLWEFDEETGDRLYWSNRYGWVPEDEADQFTEEESDELNLPLGGEWEEQ